MPASHSEFLSLSQYLNQEMYRLQSRLSRDYFQGRPFNPGSKDQVAILMNRRGLDGAKLTSKGAMSTSKKSIEHLRSEEECIDLVFKWRECQKIKSTYCDPLLRIAEEQLANSDNPNSDNDTFTVHGNFKPVTVETRRLSMSEPSLLNQPGRTELGRRVRACYRTIEPEVFGAWDFSGQEMRVAAHVSQDDLLSQLFCNCRYCGRDLLDNKSRRETCPKHPGLLDKRKLPKSGIPIHESGDPHEAAAIRIFNVRPEDVGEKRFKFEYRMAAKTANFGILYGMQGDGLLDLFRMFGLQWKKDDCDKLIREILRKVYPGLSQCIQATTRLAARQGFIRDLYGMIRYLPMICSSNRAESAEAGRQAFSHLVQGTAQGMMQNAMAWLRQPIIDLQDAGIEIKWRLQIHDEILFSFHRDLWEIMDSLVVEGMTKHYGLKLRVPIDVDGKMATSWEQLK